LDDNFWIVYLQINELMKFFNMQKIICHIIDKTFERKWI
jgi:hypothetical protein